MTAQTIVVIILNGLGWAGVLALLIGVGWFVIDWLDERRPRP